MALFDFDHPFFEPLWRRVVVVGICIGWGAFEFATGSPFWGVAFTGVGAVAFHQMFIARTPGTTGKPDEDR